jgi:hypothetical protein
MLPILVTIRDYTKPAKRIPHVLELIASMLGDDGSLTVKFVRSLSHVIHTIHMSAWSEAALNAIAKIGSNLREHSLHRCYTTSVLLDFKFWEGLPGDLVEIAFVSNLRALMNANEKLFAVLVPMHGLLARYYRSAAFLQALPGVLGSIVKFLTEYARASMTEGDSLILVGLAFQAQNLLFAKAAFRLLFGCLAVDKSPLLPFLEKHGSCRPLLRTLQGDNPDLGFWALHSLFGLFKGLSASEKAEFPGILVSAL